MNRQVILDRLKAEGPGLRKKYGVRSLALFGSMARGDDRDGSDVDVLVTFEGKATFGNLWAPSSTSKTSWADPWTCSPRTASARPCDRRSRRRRSLSRRPEQRPADIVLCCEKTLRFTAGMDQARLAEDELVTDAVLRNIEVIGEATKTLPDDVRDQIPGIEWKKIAGMRDWLIHVYHRVDPEIVWNVVDAEVPRLLRSIRDFQGQDRHQPAS